MFELVHAFQFRGFRIISPPTERSAKLNLYVTVSLLRQCTFYGLLNRLVHILSRVPARIGTDTASGKHSGPVKLYNGENLYSLYFMSFKEKIENAVRNSLAVCSLVSLITTDAISFFLSSNFLSLRCTVKHLRLRASLVE